MIKRAEMLMGACVALLLATTSCKSPTAHRKVELFNGRDLAGWNYLSADPNVPREKVWSVEDGLITCQGEPVGAIYKGPEKTDFMLVVEYRWAPGTKPGNSGIFSRLHGEMKAIPQTVEVQLMHGSAGDVMGLQGRTVTKGQPRFFEIKAHPVAGDIAGVKRLSEQENAAGEWNLVEIVARGPHYTVWMNHKLVNQVDGVEVIPGMFGLQSEG